MSWTTFGHQHIKRILDLQLETGSFSHAYLFLGPKGVGKKNLALELAQKILSVKDLERHPDFVFFDAQAENDVQTVRELMEKVSWKPFVGKHKVVVIEGAHNLNVFSQNALLKTLEEPSASAIIILNAASPLLPTVTSRCQTFRFNSLSKGQKLELGALEKFLEPAEKEAAELMTGFFNTKTSRARKLALISKLAEKEAGELSEMLTEALSIKMSSLKEQPENFKIAQGILQAIKNLERNLNKKLVLQKLALS